MRITHVDRTGHPWTFDIDCTPEQGRMFERLLLSARNVGNREELNLSYWDRAEDNTAFRNEIEHVVLTALQEWVPTSTYRPHVIPPNYVNEAANLNAAKVNETANVKPVTVHSNDAPADASTDADGEENEQYYWQRF